MLFILFQRTNIAVARELYERKVLTHEFGFTNVSMGLSLVKRGGYAFHCDNSYGNTFIMSEWNIHYRVKILFTSNCFQTHSPIMKFVSCKR